MLHPVAGVTTQLVADIRVRMRQVVSRTSRHTHRSQGSGATHHDTPLDFLQRLN